MANQIGNVSTLIRPRDQAMPKHPTGKDQHIVPQQMIRNFAGDDGKLIEMLKPELVIATRRRAPKGILFGDDDFTATPWRISTRNCSGLSNKSLRRCIPKC